MRGGKRPQAAISGANIARAAAATAGHEVRVARQRRRLSQAALAARIGLSRARLAEIEAGAGGGAPLDVWFALAQALDRYLKFEFARDPRADLADAGHLAIQELVARVGRTGGWEVELESGSGAGPNGRSVDVRLIHRTLRRIVIVECWNTFGDLGAAARSSNAKVRQAGEQAAAIAGEGRPFEVGLVWVVRDTKSNRALLARYPELFASRFPGPSQVWVAALAGQAPPPTRPGLVWADTKCTRVFARRIRRAAR